MTRLLLVEDYPPLATVVAIALRRRLGCEVLRLGGVRRALAAEGPFDLAVLDMDLPDGDGLELATELAQRGVQRLVFFTAGREQARLDQAWKLGPVIAKTEGVERLVQIVDQSLEEAMKIAVGGEGERAPSTPRGTSGTRRRIR